MSVYRPTYTDPKTGESKTASTWWVDFTIAKKRVRESTNTTRKTIAVEYEKQRRRDLERALAGLPTEEATDRIKTVSEALNGYREGYKVNHRARSVAWIGERGAHIHRLLGALRLPDVTADRIRSYMRTRQAEGAGNRTINMELEITSRAIGRTWRELWPKVKKLEEPKDAGRALSSDEEQALLDAAALNRSRTIHTFIRIALFTAMRYSEIRTLRWRQIDLAGRAIRVGQSKTASGTGRVIPMNDNLAAVLEHRDWLESEKGIGAKVQPDWFVFPFSSRVKPVDPARSATTIKSAWEAVRDKSGVACRFHDLRHTTLTKWAEVGVPESTMLALAGHMSRAMLERYSHIRLSAKRVAVDGLTIGNASKPENHVKDSPKVDGAGVSGKALRC